MSKRKIITYPVLIFAAFLAAVLFCASTASASGSFFADTAGKVKSYAAADRWSDDSAWSVLSLARSGRLAQGEAQAYYNRIAAIVKNNHSPVINEQQASDNAKAVIALTAAGYDPMDVGGYDLTEPFSNIGYIMRQGINGPIWSLIALNSDDYPIGECPTPKAQASRTLIIDTILKAQKTENGVKTGWAFSGNKADPDMTAMALCALAPYSGEDGRVSEAVTRALNWLSSKQTKTGTFSTGGTASSEEVSQVIIALTSLGINPEKDSRFNKGGKGAVSGLMTFAVNGGGFKHISSAKTANSLATVQGYEALTAYYRFQDQSNSLYDLTDGENYRIDTGGRELTPPGGSGGGKTNPSGGSGSNKNQSQNTSGKKTSGNTGKKTGTTAKSTKKSTAAGASKKTGSGNNTSEENRYQRARKRTAALSSAKARARAANKRRNKDDREEITGPGDYDLETEPADDLEYGSVKPSTESIGSGKMSGVLLGVTAGLAVCAAVAAFFIIRRKRSHPQSKKTP